MAIGMNGHLGSSQLPFGLFLGHLAQILQVPVLERHRRRARAVSSFRRGTIFSLVSVSRAGGFDEACGFATLLAGIRIFDELK